jgi:hypothetical protein
MGATRVKLAETGFSGNIARTGKNGENEKKREYAGEGKETNTHPISDTILFFSYPRTLASPC